MKAKLIFTALLLCSLIVLTSCESEVERKQRNAKEAQQRIELEASLENERQEKAIYDKYINN